MKRFYIYGIAFIYLICANNIYSMLYKTKTLKDIIKQQPAKNGIFILLDDGESKKKIGAITATFLKLILQQAGPILVSASIIMNPREGNPLIEKDPQILAKRYKEIDKKSPFIENLSPEDAQEKRDIILSVAAFDSQKAKHWIIKEVTNELYLLIPKNYLQNHNINPQNVEEFTEEKALTPLELKLGLKVNHMRTVSITDIKGSWRNYFQAILRKFRIVHKSWEYCPYFMPSVWDVQNDKSLIFVINKEYKQYNKIPPLWSIFIEGHGDLKKSIVGILLQDFKNFLNFLDKKIHTRLLYYASCYAAGLNSKEIYNDLEKSVDKTYPFTIITQALTDTVTGNFSVDVHFKDGTLKPKISGNYSAFFREITSADAIDYYKLGALLTPDLERGDTFEVGGLGSLAQVKLPGVEWFTVIERDKAVPIGEVLAKTRTKPLNIETFFARKGQKAKPLALLLYASDIPFELIINTERQPGIISMIPGDATHHIKKITSTSQSVDTIINSFFHLGIYLKPRKIFIIDEVFGINSDVMKKILNSGINATNNTLLLKNITITLNSGIIRESQKYKISFEYNDKIYQINGKLTADTIAQVKAK